MIRKKGVRLYLSLIRLLGLGGLNGASSKLKCNTNPEVLCCNENQIQTS
jgi:hypothetical protein